MGSRAPIHSQPLEEAAIRESQLFLHPAPSSLLPGPPSLIIWFAKSLGIWGLCLLVSQCGHQPWDTGTARCVYVTPSLGRARVNLPVEKRVSLGETIRGGQPSIRRTKTEGHALSCPPQDPSFLGIAVEALRSTISSPLWDPNSVIKAR